MNEVEKLARKVNCLITAALIAGVLAMGSCFLSTFFRSPEDEFVPGTATPKRHAPPPPKFAPRDKLKDLPSAP